MKNKKWLLVLILIIPSFFWVMLEMSTINSKKLNYYGPKKLNQKDTVFYEVSSDFFITSDQDSSGLAPFLISEPDYPLYAIMFIKKAYNEDTYRLGGLLEHLNYKKEKIGHIPFFLVTEFEHKESFIQNNLTKLAENKNVTFLALPPQKFDSLNKVYFTGKPIHIDYSFFVLVDQNRNIRGYYDGRFAAEVKRLTDEYKHLRLKEAKQKLIKENEINIKK
jgi:hypothetical protein